MICLVNSSSVFSNSCQKKYRSPEKKKDTLFNIAQHNKMLTTALVFTIGSMADIHYNWAFQQHLKEARILRKRQGFKEKSNETRVPFHLDFTP